MNEKRCRYSYRKGNDVSLHCKAQKERGIEKDYCAHQYLCPQTRQWENSPRAMICPYKENHSEK